MDKSATDREHEEYLARVAETEALIARANDPEDSYDGHHGNDRSAEDALARRAE